MSIPPCCATCCRAARAPSGGNIQPWHLHVVTGDALVALKRVMVMRLAAAPDGEGAEYDIYPRKLTSPYRERMFEIGEALYGRLGIPRKDKAARKQWFARNFGFFDAPVGLFCFVDRGHGPPQWSDLGMYQQTLMLLLREPGLDSWAQECWALYSRTIAAFVHAPADQMLFTGMTIGWRNPADPVNDLATPRAPLEHVAQLHALAPGGAEPAVR